MKNSKLFFIFVMIVFTIFSPTIKAVTDIESLPSNVSNVCTAHSCWPQYNSKVGKSVRGMRVSLMKTDGTAVGETYNIVADDSHYQLLTNYGNFIVLGSNCNKVQYEIGKCNATVQTQKNWSGSPWSGGRLGAASAVASYFSHLNVPLQSYLSNWNIEDVWNWADTEKLPISDDRTIKLLNLLFGLSKEEILEIAGNPDLLNDLWIVAEPFTMLRYNYKTYLGTNYELAKLDYAGMLKSNITSVVGRMMPCAAMTTGDIAKKYPNAPGVSTGSYFNGKLVYVNPSTEVASSSGSSTITQICSSSKKFKNGYPNSNKGVGVGLIYFRDLFKNDLSCEEVNSGMSDYNGFMNKLDNAYKSGGISSVFQLPEVSNGIKYTYNGEQKVADQNWYINECTCYGLYDTYKSSTGQEIFKLPLANIKTIFTEKVTLFTTFVDSIKEYVKTVAETKPETVGSVTTWDFDKYERLKCEYTSSTCEDVDFGELSSSGVKNPSQCYTSCISSGNFSRCYNDCLSTYYNYQSQSSTIRKCQSLPLFPDKNFTNSYVNANASLYNQCFSLYNQQFGTSWTLSSYKAAGCSPEDNNGKKKYDCTPRYNVGTCINQENVFYNDSSSELNGDDYWKYCVFSDDQASYDIDPHKWSDKTKDPTYFDSNITSDYCEVYCIENLTGAFNSETIKVKAGQHFIWNDHSVSGSRTCKTKSIEWDKFTSALAKKNDEIEKAFNTYLVARDQQASVKQYTVKNGCSECISWYPTRPCSNGKGTCGGGCRRYRYWDETCIKWDSATYGSGATYAHGSAGSACSCSGYPSDDRFGRDSKYQTWDNMKDDAKYIYDQMRKCYNEDKGSSWVSTMSAASGEGASWDQWLYIVDPTAVVKYNYTINGSTGLYIVDEDMDRTISYTGKTNVNDCQTVAGGIEVLTKCSNATSSCTRQMLSIKKCTEVEMSKGANIEFSIPEGIYEYVNKDNHISFNADQFETIKSEYVSQGKSFNYIYLGYSNFPVEYKTPDGIYGKDYGNGELSITYKDLGYKLPNKTTAVDTILSGVDSSKYGQWQCQFEVVSKLIPDDNNPYDPDIPGSPKEGDIKLIYRPIDLHNPFPDITADGRNTGSNWCVGGEDRADCSNTNANVQDYILNNRNVEGHDLYYEEPMYTFILTPAIIKEIRRYNDNNSYAEYYGSYNGKVYDFKCEEGTGRTCISEYLSYLIDITDAKNQPGVCVDDKYRSYNDPNNFDACRY